jgi:hypothetical protein
VRKRERDESATYVDLDVQILQIKRMLPDINAEDGQMRDERVLVRRCRDLELLRLRVHALTNQVDQQTESSTNFEQTHEPTPPRPLNRQRRRVELLLQSLETSKRRVNRILERARVELPAVAALFGRGSEIPPEEGVVDVACAYASVHVQ